MRSSPATLGRVFVLQLEDGDILHAAIERFARRNRIRAAALIVVGCAARGSRLVVGPARSSARKIVPLGLTLPEAHEICGTGTLFPDENGRPLLHMHIACGRRASARTGCVRRGVRVWLTAEVILFELVRSRARRRTHPGTGFKLLMA